MIAFVVFIISKSESSYNRCLPNMSRDCVGTGDARVVEPVSLARTLVRFGRAASIPSSFKPYSYIVVDIAMRR